MGLDELFELLDCYVEQSSWDPNKIWYSTSNTTGITENINEVCSAKISPSIYKVQNGNTTSTADLSSFQSTTNH